MKRRSVTCALLKKVLRRLPVAELLEQRVALRGRQRRDCRLDQTEGLGCEKLRLGGAPWLRERRPAARVVRVLEPVGIDGRLAGFRILLEGGEGTRARLALGTRLRSVREDPE